MRSVLAVAAWLCAAATGAAQCPLNATFTGGGSVSVVESVDGDVDVTIQNVIAGTQTLQLFDSCIGPNGPTKDVRSIRIFGTLQDTAARLRVLVANPTQSGFPLLPTIDIPAGLRTIGDQNSPGFVGLGFGSVDLQDQTVVAIAVTGNIHGSINCGRVFRIQAVNTAFDNEISATITATAKDESTDPSIADATYAINVIRAGNGITGKIEARGERIGDDQIVFPGSIGRVSVGPGPDPLTGPPIGIQGDIIASGRIGSIFSTGDIGGA